MGYHVQHGNFLGCHQLYRWILKNLSTQFALETVVQQLKHIFSTHTPDVVLVEKLMAEVYFATATNVLCVGISTGRITRYVIDHVWDLYKEAVMHAYRAGDELLITDLNWAVFIPDCNIDIDGRVVRRRKQKQEFIWENYEIMPNDFIESCEFFATRNDAARIKLI